MQKALLIAEKPSLRRTIETVYNKHKSEIPYEITFTEQRGHLVTLVKPDELDETLKQWSWDTLPFHPENYGGWKYEIIEEKKTGNFLTAKERFKHIKDEIRSGQYDFVINAGDPDQEGELLIRIVLDAIGNKLPVKRYWSNDTTESKVVDALKNLKDDDKDLMLVNLLKAAHGREHSDYRFGMNLSRAVSLQLGVRSAIGRVKTPILAIVCRREDEIANFVPKTVYGVAENYDEDFQGTLFDTSKEAPESDEEKEVDAGVIWFDKKEDAQAIIDKLGSSAVVTDFKTAKQTTYAPKLFKLATCQVAAGKFGFDSAKTLETIQGLYERGLLTYPRTDCEYISSNENFKALLSSATAVPDLVPFINRINDSTIAKVRATKKWVNDKALTESGHSALLPTTKKPDFSSLTEDEKKIYELICRQYVAIFLPPLVQDRVTLLADNNGHTFRSVGKTVIDAGFTEIFNTNITESVIPAHKTGDTLAVDGCEIIEKTSTCPKRFTDADLIAVCEAPHRFLIDESLKTLGKKLKIGTPATRAGIIGELIDKCKYLQRKKEGRTTYIVPTELGTKLYTDIKTCKICRVDMTGEWELMLEDVRSGQMSFSDFEKKMIEDVNSLLDDIRSQVVQAVRKDIQKTVVTKCPACGGDIISGPKGFYCSNWKVKNCGMGAYKKICDSEITDKEFMHLLAGEEIDKPIKKGSTTWTQKLKYDPAEHKVVFVQRDAPETKATEYICPNPKCGGEIENRGKLLKCKKCGFTLWTTTCGVELSDKQIERFFDKGSTGVVKGLISKKGNKFEAEIVMKKDGSGTEFRFPDND